MEIVCNFFTLLFVIFTEDQQLFSYPHSSKYLLLCSTEERTLCRFRTTWVNYDIIFIFW